jgi:hypothetical protein
VSGAIVTGFVAYGGNPGGKARPTRQSRATHAAKARDGNPHGKGPTPKRDLATREVAARRAGT